MTEKMAILIDGENISFDTLPEILDHSRRIGPSCVQRVYGNATRLPAWAQAAGFKLVHSGTGKNSADMCLTIEALELSYQHGFGSFVLVSSDSDFTHLALKLREQGKFVLGLGDHRAPEMFREACSMFRELGDNSAGSCDGATAPVPKTLDLKIRAAIQSHSKNSSGIEITTLGQIMFKQHGFKISSLESKNWRGYLSQNPQKYELDPKGPHAKVRFLSTGF